MYIVKTQSSKKKNYKLEDFLIKFVPKKIRKESSVTSSVSEEQKAKNKSAVLGMLGLTPDGEYKYSNRKVRPAKPPKVRKK